MRYARTGLGIAMGGVCTSELWSLPVNEPRLSPRRRGSWSLPEFAEIDARLLACHELRLVTEFWYRRTPTSAPRTADLSTARRPCHTYPTQYRTRSISYPNISCPDQYLSHSLLSTVHGRSGA
eukprot:1652566-Rhodomonas_salina.3